MAAARSLRSLKARLRRAEAIAGRRDLPRRRALNARILRAGACREGVRALLERDFPGQTFQKVGTEGCTFRRTDGGLYVKFLTDRQYDYYTSHSAVIEQYHAPYVLRPDGKYLAMDNFGPTADRLDAEVQERASQWARGTLRILHRANVYHGDVLATSVFHSTPRVNLGNVLWNEREFRLIDFGPLDTETRSDAELLRVERALLAGPPPLKRTRKTQPPRKRKRAPRDGAGPPLVPRQKAGRSLFRDGGNILLPHTQT